MNEQSLAFGIVVVAFVVIAVAILLGFASVLGHLPELPR